MRADIERPIKLGDKMIKPIIMSRNLENEFLQEETLDFSEVKSITGGASDDGVLVGIVTMSVLLCTLYPKPYGCSGGAAGNCSIHNR